MIAPLHRLGCRPGPRGPGARERKRGGGEAEAKPSRAKRGPRPAHPRGSRPWASSGNPRLLGAAAPKRSGDSGPRPPRGSAAMLPRATLNRRGCCGLSRFLARASAIGGTPRRQQPKAMDRPGCCPSAHHAPVPLRECCSSPNRGGEGKERGWAGGRDITTEKSQLRAFLPSSALQDLHGKGPAQNPSGSAALLRD